MLSENTILKAIHNYRLAINLPYRLRMLSENTILKAIHNKLTICFTASVTANAK